MKHIFTHPFSRRTNRESKSIRRATSVKLYEDETNQRFVRFTDLEVIKYNREIKIKDFFQTYACRRRYTLIEYVINYNESDKLDRFFFALKKALKENGSELLGYIRLVDIGENGAGFQFAMKTLAGGRIGIAAQALGIASGAYERALAYSKERKAFGKEIGQHQAIQFKLADMATRIEAARLLCFKAAWEKDHGMDYAVSSSMAKVFASETAMWVTTEAVQVHGGYGYVKEYHVERLMRDAKITQIYEGTSEVQRIVIGRSLLK